MIWPEAITLTWSAAVVSSPSRFSGTPVPLYLSYLSFSLIRSFSLHTYVDIHLSLSHKIDLYTFLSNYLFLSHKIYLSIYLSIHLYICIYPYLSLSLSLFHKQIYLYIYQSFNLCALYLPAGTTCPSLPALRPSAWPSRPLRAGRPSSRPASPTPAPGTGLSQRFQMRELFYKRPLTTFWWSHEGVSEEDKTVFRFLSISMSVLFPNH